MVGVCDIVLGVSTVSSRLAILTVGAWGQECDKYRTFGLSITQPGAARALAGLVVSRGTLTGPSLLLGLSSPVTSSSSVAH